MPKVKINDLPNTAILEDNDSFEVSRFNSNNRVSSHVNYSSIVSQLESSLFDSSTDNKGARFNPNPFGTGFFAKGGAGIDINYLIYLPEVATRCHYQVFDIDLSALNANIPAEATHVLLNINYLASGINYVFSHFVFGIDGSEDPATGVIANFDAYLTQLSVDPTLALPATQSAINIAYADTIASLETNGPMQTSVNGDFAVPINNPGQNVKFVLAVSQNLIGNWQTPAHGFIPKMTLATSCRGWYV